MTHPPPAISVLCPTPRGGWLEVCAESVRLCSSLYDYTVHLPAAHDPMDFGTAKLCPCLGAPGSKGLLRHLAKPGSTTHLIAGADVLHVHGQMPNAVGRWLLAAVRSRVPVVATPHNLFSSRRTHREATWLRSLDAIMLLNERDAARLSQEHRHVVVGPHVLPIPDVDDAAVLATRNELLDELGVDMVAVFVGQIRDDKNPVLAADIVAAARHAGLKYGLLVVGRGKDAPKMLAAAEKAAVPTKHVAHYVDHADLLAYLGASDVALCPYRLGSQSGVDLHATEMGTPVLRSNAIDPFVGPPPTAPPAAWVAQLPSTPRGPELRAPDHRGRSEQALALIAAHRRLYEGVGCR